MSAPNDTCLGCKHFLYSSGDRGYSEETPGYPATMDCWKKVWEFNFEDDSSEKHRACLLTAPTCKLFELADHAKEKERE